MAHIVLFHHSGGLTDGVLSLAQTLRDAGHRVEAPDLFGGRTFPDISEGMAYAESVGEDAFAARATEIVSDLPADLIYGGLSMGAARAAEQVIARPGAQGAFFLYGAVAPSWWQASWPAGVPSQAHVGEADPFREQEAEAEYVAQVPDAELFAYPGAGHLFAEPGHPDFQEAAARLTTERVLSFLSRAR